jgi:hypothetical protein
MRPARAFATLALFSALALVAGGSAGQDKDKKGDPPSKPTGRDRLPMYFDQLGLTDAQKATVLKLDREHRDRKEKLLEEIRKPDEEMRRKRIEVLTDDQRKKLIDLVAGPPLKDKAKDK